MSQVDQTFSLPIDTVLADLKKALAVGCGAVLQAPPGAGKTTAVPLALLHEPWLGGRRIVMLEPRRLAARAAAYRMADSLQETVGQTVGYRVRLDTRVGPKTRIEVVTEGVLTRMLQSDAALSGVGLVIFDEFHERHLESDIGLALCLDIQGVLNEDLRLLVMSATLDAASAADLLGNPGVITCKGRSFPVETRYAERRRHMLPEKVCADAVLQAAARDTGSILVFLPGAAEIRNVMHRLEKANLGPEWLIAPLFGNLSREEQERAIVPPPDGRRKIVLATNIAETSLTIEGIRIVVDSGLMRRPRFDVRSGMTRLATLAVSRASADQRRGRAGRTAPGICYRLWPRELHVTLAPYNRPEILEADLAGLALELALWGIRDPQRLKWLDPPPPAAFKQARTLLTQLGAIKDETTVTDHGRRMADLPLHPRLAHMILSADAVGLGAPACEVAALLSERDIMRFSRDERTADLRVRFDALQRMKQGRLREPERQDIDRPSCRRVLRMAETLKQRIGIQTDSASSLTIGRLLAWAYPERIARRRPNAHGRYLMVNGRGAFFDRPDPLAAGDYLVAAELDGERREARIFLAAAYDEETLLDQYGDRVRSDETIAWSPKQAAVVDERTLRLGAVTLRSESLKKPDPEKVRTALIEGIRQQGCNCLPWTKALRQWQARLVFLRRIFSETGEWPDVSDRALIATLEDWLAPYLYGVNRLRDLERVRLKDALTAILPRQQRKRFDELAPTHLNVPSGSRISIDYSGETPVLAVRLQEVFGVAQTPAIAGGRQSLLLHLLSPAGRPVQVTRDLAGFWQTGYHEVKKQLKGRYPKHFWPEDPLSAVATARTKPRKKPSS